jgi:uncharacterized delta-60 repeat protein
MHHLSAFATILCLATAFSDPPLSAQQFFTAGTLDTSFASGLNGSVQTVLLQPDGRLLVGGGFYVPGVMSYTRLVRLTANGAYDPSFSTMSGAPSQILALQPDGKVLIGSQWGLSRLFPDGNLDPGFHLSLPNPAPDRLCCFWATALTVHTNGKILVAGYRLYRGSEDDYWTDPQVYRLLPDGSLDNSFTPFPAIVQKIAVLPDDRILVMGITVARLDPDGTTDASFVAGPFSPGPFGTPSLQSFAFQPDGRILVGGSFTNVQGHIRDRIARLWPNGQLDLSFNPPPSTGDSHQVTAIALQSDGRILVGGTFNTMDGLPYAGLARLNTDGSLDPTFPPISGIQEDGEGSVFSVVLQDETRALIGGGGLGTPGIFESDDLFRIHLGEPAPRLSIAGVSGGEFRLTYTYSGSNDFTVLTSTNLSLPAMDWTMAGSATRIGEAQYEFTLVPAEAHRFYQLRRTGRIAAKKRKWRKRT